MTTMSPILARFQNSEPVLIDPMAHAHIDVCAAQASKILERIEAAADEPRMDDGDGFWFSPDDWRAQYRPYVVKDGVLQIPVKGILLNNFAWNIGNWATGYEYIWRAFDRGQRDPEVRGVALVCDTPGGVVAGNFELVDKMHAYPNRKPLMGVASESAYSAGYSIISVADPGQVVVSRTGGVGSIGVVTMHFDVSKAMEQLGWNATYIHAGKHKVDGNPYEALPDDVKARIQARIDDLYGIFVKTVARNRGLEEQAVRDTEALTYSAPDALSVGLADKIGPFDDALADFSASLNPNVGDETMADTFSQADIDAAVATATANHAAELAAARSDGATAERARINDILASDVGKDRPKAALSAALKTGMDLETATAFLAELPKESAAVTETSTTNAGAPQGMLDAAMDNTDNPNIEAQTKSEQSDDDLAIDQSFGGRKAKKAA